MDFTISVYRRTSSSFSKLHRSRQHRKLDNDLLKVLTDISSQDMRKVILAYLTREVEAGDLKWINSSLAQHDLHVKNDFLETSEGRRIVIEDLTKTLTTLSNEELDRNVWFFENEIILIEGQDDHGSAYEGKH